MTNAGFAEKEQPAFDHGKLLCHLARTAQRVFKGVVIVGDEVVKRAVIVAPRNARVGHEPLVDVVAPAVAACDAFDVAILERLPTGTVTEGTYGLVVRRRNHAT